MSQSIKTTCLLLHCWTPGGFLALKHWRWILWCSGCNLFHTQFNHIVEHTIGLGSVWRPGQSFGVLVVFFESFLSGIWHCSHRWNIRWRTWKLVVVVGYSRGFQWFQSFQVDKHYDWLLITSCFGLNGCKVGNVSWVVLRRLWRRMTSILLMSTHEFHLMVNVLFFYVWIWWQIKTHCVCITVNPKYSALMTSLG